MAVTNASLGDRAKAAALLMRAGHTPGKVPIPRLRTWTERYVPQYQWYRHCELIGAQLERLIHGDLAFLFVFTMPRAGKSELVSRILPPHYLHLFPHHWAAISSYSDKLAQSFSRASRARFPRPLNMTSTAVDNWQTAAGGGCWASGVGGTQAGLGYHLGVCDDPVKDAQDAESPTVQATNADWWDSVWYTRREPGAVNLLTLTRWHLNDVGGHVLRSMQARGFDGVAVVHLPALAESREDVEALYEDFPGIEIVSDWRAPGEPLCPERFTLQDLHQIQRGMTDYFWSALYQQRPIVRGGSMFPRDRVTFAPAVPTQGRVLTVRYWDKAGTEGGGAFTAGVKLTIVGQGDAQMVYIEDVRRGQMGALEREREIVATARLDGRGVYIRVEQEPGSGGLESAEATIRRLAGYRVDKDKVTGDKTLRADLIAAQWQAGNVVLVGDEDTAWVRPFLGEVELFPRGTYRDQTDAMSGAYNTAIALLESRPRLVGGVGGPVHPAYAVPGVVA